jgi:hypothetical protein
MIEILQRLSGLELLGLAVTLGLVVVLTPTLALAQWRVAGEAKRNASLKREMLARELSVDEIDRLTAPAAVRQAQIDADRRVREAQIAADLKRELVARGLSAEDVQRLTLKKGERVGASEGADALAGAIVKMVQGEGHLDRGAVAGLLALFLEKDTAIVGRSGQAKPATQVARGPEPDALPGEKGARELHSVPAEPLAADRPHD